MKRTLSPPGGNNGTSSGDDTIDKDKVLASLKVPSKKSRYADGLPDVSTLKIEKMVGSGVYGTVFKARDPKTGKLLALKKMSQRDKEREKETKEVSLGFPITTLREVKILKAINHENVVKLLDLMIARAGRNEDNTDRGVVRYCKDDFFMVFEYLPFDLVGLIHSRDFMLTPDRILWFSKQLLMGLFEIHRNNIMNRDIKPANILVSRKNVLKIADWGLGRSFTSSDGRHTHHVITRWYRPPELFLETRKYGPEVDMWSAGCVIAEIAMRTGLIKGATDPKQLEGIYELIGSPSGDVLEKYKKYPGFEKCHIDKEYPPRIQERLRGVDPALADLIIQLLQLDPAKRMTADQAIDHDVFWNKSKPLRPEK